MTNTDGKKSVDTMGGRTFVGTSGFSYADWVGHFYPQGTRKADFLEYYGRHFDTLEINYTYYRMPTRATMASLVEKSGGGLRFSVKLTDVFTHSLSGGEREAREFARALDPLVGHDLLGCLLAQFPYSFKPGPNSYRHLGRLSTWFPDLPVVVEVRNARWISQDFFGFLKDNGLGFCNVDQPTLKGLLPPLNVVTSSVAYARFHGRNSDKWWQHERPEQRYDYLYSKEELLPWVPKLNAMSDRAEELYVFFNNHFEGKAVQNAGELAELLNRASGP